MIDISLIRIDILQMQCIINNLHLFICCFPSYASIENFALYKFLTRSAIIRTGSQFTDLFKTTFYRPIDNNITFESRNMKRINFTDIDLNVFLNERNAIHVFFLHCHKHVIFRFYDLMYSDFTYAEPEETEFDSSICLIICYHMSLGLL